MTRSRCYLAASLVVLLLLLIWAPTYPGHESDYGLHYSLIIMLDEGRIQDSIPYQGLLASHGIATLLVKVGYTIPTAMGILSYFCLWLILLCVFAVVVEVSLFNTVLGILSFAAISIPMAWEMMNAGFYSQFAGMGMYALLLLVLITVDFSKNWTVILALAVAAIAVFSYPDGAMWFFPTIALKLVYERREKKSWVLSLGLLACVFVLIILQIHLLSIGAARPYWSELSLAAACLVGALVYSCAVRLRRKSFHLNDTLLLTCIVCFLLSAAAVILASLSKYGAIRYYSVKNLYWSMLLVPLCFRITSKTLIGTAVLCLAVVVFYMRLERVIHIDPQKTYAKLISPVSPVDSLDDACFRFFAELAKKSQCTKTLAFPGYHHPIDSHGRRASRIAVFNMLLDSFDIDSDGVHLRVPKAFEAPLNYAEAYNTEWYENFSFEELGISDGDCLLVPSNYKPPAPIQNCPAYKDIPRQGYALVRYQNEASQDTP